LNTEMISNYPQLDALHRGIIVSCQEAPNSPLNSPDIIAAMAKAAEIGGAVGLRVDRPENIAAVRMISKLPIIGIYKIHLPDTEVYITPTLSAAEAVIAAGADLVALDATGRQRGGKATFAEITGRIHEKYAIPVMADIGTTAQGIRAWKDGADLIATTMATSNPYGKPEDGPAVHILKELVQAVDRPVIVEGQIWTVENVHACFSAGAFAVVIGSAITAPELITRRFIKAIPKSSSKFSLPS
jgi:N-acylglucosamine-6-phosphate 2-epimerase